MVMLSSKARICPRGSYQTQGWVVSEFGLTYCVMCGHILANSGHRGVSFKSTFQEFARVRKQSEDNELIHECQRKEQMDNDLTLSRISHTPDSCCRAHNGRAGRLPICTQGKQQYDALAEKSVDDRIKSEDILDS
jgi:hypothetical protein